MDRRVTTKAFRSIETIKDDTLVEVELMLTTEELERFGQACFASGMKFNDWIRFLAYKELEKQALS